MREAEVFGDHRPTEIKLDAIILAAGTSSRMGRAKQLLPLSGKFLLECVICEVLCFPFARVLTVIGHGADDIAQNIQIDDPRFSWVHNPSYQSGQGSSLRAGLEQAFPAGEPVPARGEQRSAAVVFLGDLPFVRSGTISHVLEKGRELMHRESGPFMIQPFFEKTPGHPVFFGNMRAELIRLLDGKEGGKRLREWVRTVPLEVDDPGVIMDIDTPDAYERAVYIAEKRAIFSQNHNAEVKRE